MKVALLANSNCWLTPFYDELSRKHDVWWGTHEREVFDQLRVKYKNVCFEPHAGHTTSKSGNRYSYGESGAAEQALDRKLKPDIWITDVANRIAKTPKTCFWVYAFHSFCYKKYLFHKSTEKFDLLLLPSDYFKEEFVKKLGFTLNDKRLAVTGFPKLDPLMRGEYRSYQTKCDLGLDPDKKTVLYAPTWGGASSKGMWGNKLWCRWNESQHFEIFEKFANSISEANANLIVKVHHVCDLAERERLAQFCRQSGIGWVDDSPALMADILPILDCADVLVSDMSGAIAEFVACGKPVVCIDPESAAAWHESSIPKRLLPSTPVSSVQGLIDNVQDALCAPDTYFVEQRRATAATLFKYRDGQAAKRAAVLIERLLHR